MSTRKKTFGTDDILLILCKSVTKVLSQATDTKVTYAPVVQRITKTSLKPDIGCFVLFDGVFSGLVIINFSADSAMELYSCYLRHMGMPEDELATRYTSDEVGNTLGELMNQMVGEFSAAIEHELMVSVNQSQPKMIAVSNEVVLSINANLDTPQARKVAFQTQGRHPFYMEMAMEKTTFVQLVDVDRKERENVDDLIAAEQNRGPEESAETGAGSGSADDLLESLGI
jgi:chemotaxis protein CheY-P-specific phosphatase CheC